MNIVVRTYSGKIISRPDTTWERLNRDFFVPEFIDEISYSPILFARISRPGKSIKSSFAERYFDAFGEGTLLYPENLIDGSEEGFAEANCINHTSFLPAEVEDKALLDESRKAVLADAIEATSHRCFLRSGDFVAVEQSPRKHLCSRTDKEFNFNNLFNIVF